MHRALIDIMDTEGLLKLLTDLDWKVGRTEKEASEMV